MNRDREQMWQAYVDGELSACEAAQFESSLTEPERARLTSEMRLERALSERMRGAVPCPAELWQRVRASALETEDAIRRGPARRWVLAGTTLAAAAALAFVLSDVAGLFDSPEEPNVILAAESLAELKAASETEPGWENAQTFLQAKGVVLTIEDREHLMILMMPHAPIEIIGARQDRIAGGEVTELLVACCDKPVKILLARKHTPAARAIVAAAADDGNDVQATRKVKGYVAAVVAKHPSSGLVNIVDAEVH